MGIDTPTLLGVWETAPYLHDGSAPTLRDVLTTANANDDHAFVSELMPAQIDQLVAYLQQIDNELPPHRLPFEAALMDAGSGDAEAGAPEAAPPIVPALPESKGCACELTTSRHRSTWAGWILVPLLLLHGRRRNKKVRPEAPR